MISKIAIVISMIALAAFLIIAGYALLNDGLKGLRTKGKLLVIAFLIYAVTFIVFFIVQ